MTSSPDFVAASFPIPIGYMEFPGSMFGGDEDDITSSGMQDLLGPADYGAGFTSPYPSFYDRQPQSMGAGSRSGSYSSVKYYLNSILIPGILAFGAIGNALCLSLIINRAGRCPRFRVCVARLNRRSAGNPVASTTHGSSGGGPARLQPLERSALVGLGALALSDLLFCLVGLPSAWLAPTGSLLDDGAPFAAHLAFYYKAYQPPLQNMFLFSSTWIAVAIAVERFIAVINPIRARWFLKVCQPCFAFEFPVLRCSLCGRST
jgi:hypothetical protein